MNMIVKDFGWFLLKDNAVVNYIYYLAYRFYVKRLKIGDFDTGWLKIHPAYKDFDFSGRTNKEFVLDNVKGFSSTSGMSFKGCTSGTTNAPMPVFRSLPSVLYDELSLRSHWYSTGVRFNPKIATLRGDNLFPGDYSGSEYWKCMPFTRRLIMSSFHLNSKTAKLYFDALDKHQPEVILAYPSVIKYLAGFAKTIGWKPSWKNCNVYTSGESFSREDQTKVREVFSELYDHYGQAERVARLQQCKNGNYHTVSWFSKVEFVRDDEGVHVIGTNYRNKAMPLYRYDSGDLVEGVHIDGLDCGCGLDSSYATTIKGRTSDEFELPSGVLIGPAAISLLFYDIDGISEAQVVQQKNGGITVKYSTLSSSRDMAIESKLQSSFSQRFGELNLTAQYCEEIPRTKSGKLQPVVREK